MSPTKSLSRLEWYNVTYNDLKYGFRDTCRLDWTNKFEFYGDRECSLVLVFSSYDV
jgi:hypothetical protein